MTRNKDSPPPPTKRYLFNAEVCFWPVTVPFDVTMGSKQYACPEKKIGIVLLMLIEFAVALWFFFKGINEKEKKKKEKKDLKRGNCTFSNSLHHLRYDVLCIGTKSSIGSVSRSVQLDKHCITKSL